MPVLDDGPPGRRGLRGPGRARALWQRHRAPPSHHGMTPRVRGARGSAPHGGHGPWYLAPGAPESDEGGGICQSLPEDPALDRAFAATRFLQRMQEPDELC